MKYCPNCPRTYPDEMNFCLNDGMRLQTPTAMREADTLITISEETLITPMSREDARSLFAESSVEQTASRVNDELALQKKRSAWRNSVQGVQDAAKEVETLLKDFQDLIQRINEANPEIQIDMTVELQRHGNILTADRRAGLSIHWGNQYGNNLDYSGLTFTLFQPGSFATPLKEISKTKYDADIDENLRVGWRAQSGKKDFHTSYALADIQLKALITRVQSRSRRM